MDNPHSTVELVHLLGSYYGVHDGKVDLDLALQPHIGQIKIYSGSVSRVH